MQGGRWNDTATQVVKTRITVNGIVRKGKASIDAQSFEGHPSGLTSSPATTATLALQPPRSSTAQTPNPMAAVIHGAAWPPLAGQPVTVEVGDGDQWWTVFTGRVDDTGGAMSDAGLLVECVGESIRLELRAPLGALHWRNAYANTGLESFGQATPAPFDLQSATLVEHAARSAGFAARMAPDDTTVLYVPMVGSAHPAIGQVYFADFGTGGTTERAVFSGPDGPTVIGNKWLSLTHTTATGSVVEATMDLPPRTPGSGWTSLLVKGKTTTDRSGEARAPFVAYDHNDDVIRWGFATSMRTAGAVPTSAVTRQGTPIPRAGASRVALRFTARDTSSVLHRFQVRTDTGAAIDTRLTDSSGDIEAGWGSKYTEYLGAGPMGAVHVAFNPPAFATLAQAPTARIRYKDVSALEATRDLGSMTSDDVLRSLADAELGAYWVSRLGRFEYAGPGVREAQPVAVTLTTDLDVSDWAWTHSTRQRAKRVRIDRLLPSAPTRPGSLLWANMDGREGLQNNELSELFATPGPDEDWLFADTKPVLISNDGGAWPARIAIRQRSVHGSTLVNTANDGEAWQLFNVTFGIEKIGRQTVKWSTQVGTLGVNEVVHLRIPFNAENVPVSYQGLPLPRLLGAKITWIERTDTYSAAPIGREEYVHDAGWWVQSAAALARLRTALVEAAQDARPEYRDVVVRADPRIDLGDHINLRDVTGTVYDAIVLAIKSDWADGAASMRLSIRLVGPGVVPVPSPEPEHHWLQQQPSFERASA